MVMFGSSDAMGLNNKGESGEPRLRTDGTRIAWSSIDEGTESSKQADVAILRVPAVTTRAADQGKESASIMRLAPAHYRDDHKPPLTQDQQRVFDHLAANGMNPTIEKNNTYTNHYQEEFWELRANWKLGQPGNSDLQSRTQTAKAGQTERAARADAETKIKESQSADALILKIPGLTREAADAGNDTVAVMGLGSGSSKPSLDEAQKKVFESLAGKGLNPSIEKNSCFDHRSQWTINANWKEGQNPNAELAVLTKTARQHATEVAASQAAAHKADEIRDADFSIQLIPSKIEDARVNGRDSITLGTVGSTVYPDYGHRKTKPTPPPLTEAEKKVFDAVKAQGLTPKFELEQDTGRSFSGSEHWVLKGYLPKS